MLRHGLSDFDFEGQARPGQPYGGGSVFRTLCLYYLWAWVEGVMTDPNALEKVVPQALLGYITLDEREGRWVSE